MSSTNGLWRSIFSGTFSPFSFSSSMLPIDCVESHSSHIQIFNGVPQYLSLDNDQSILFDSHSWNLPLPTSTGYQFILSLFAMSLSLCSEVFIYQDSLA